MSRFPGWFQISEEFPPKLFHTPDQVPPGWTRCKGRYDTQTGQWVDDDPLDHDGNGRKGGSEPQVDPLDLPAIAGFVRDGFDRDDPENGNPPRPLATFERADEIVRDDKPQADVEAVSSPKKRAKRGAKSEPRSQRERLTISPRNVKDKGMDAVNEDDKGIAKPQDNETPSRPQDPDNVAKERGNDGMVRTGNRPTKR